MIYEAISMKTLINKIIKNKEYKTLVENFASLSGLQIASYILPLITLPYLVRVLGPEKYGSIAFATAFVTYFQWLTDYGFNLSSTREISLNKDDKNKISTIFSSVMVIKFSLLVLSFIILSVVVFSFTKFRSDWLIYFFAFGMVVGNVLFPTWFFQGMEKMKYITVLNIIAKVIFTILIFVFIREASDYLYVLLINSAGMILVGIIAIIIVYNDFGIKLKIPKTHEIKQQLKDGWHVFISTVSISLYTTSNSFILGLLTNNTFVGYYAAGESIVTAIMGLWTPVSQTLYPYFSRLHSESKELAKKHLRKILIYTSFITFTLSVLFSLSAPFIVKIILGSNYTASIIIVQILVFILFAIGINNIMGIQGLVAFGYSNVFSKIVVFAGLVHLVIIITLIYLFGYVGAAVAVVNTEIVIAIIEYFAIRRLKLL